MDSQQNIEMVKEDQYKSEVDKILENLPAELDLAVDLPSRNDFYKLEDPNMPITVRAMKYEDERILADSRRKGADTVNILLERCVKNININNLLIVDKLILLLKVREATYGPTYSLLMACPVCSEKTEVTFDLNDMAMKQLPEDVKEPFEVTLPILKKKVEIRFPRVADESYLTEKRVHKNLWRFILSIGGSDNKKIINEVIKKLPLQDLHALLENIGMQEWGLEPMMNFSCPECGEESEVVVPVSENFFYKSSTN